jgi:hypothetical protein
MIDDPVQSAQDLGNPPIPIPAVFPLISLFPDGFGQEPVFLRHLQFIPLCTAMLLQALAGSPFSNSQLLNDRFYGLAARSRVYQFFEATSRRMAFSRA